MIPLTAEEIHRALTREPESQSVGELNRAVRDLREMIYQEKIRAQNAEARLAAAVRVVEAAAAIEDASHAPGCRCDLARALAAYDAARGGK